MAYAALMVQVHARGDCEPRLRLAADVANRLNAALIGVAAALYAPLPELQPWLSGADVAQADQRVVAELDQAKARFESISPTVRRGGQWRAFVESPRNVLARQARAADLLICGVGGAPVDDIQRHVSTGDLLMSAGRPLLTGPADVDHLDLSRVVLAWKDTREARRALADAMPILRRAQAVLVAGAPERDAREDMQIGLADVAELIRRHGGSHPSTRILSDRLPPADALLEAAVDFDAELIVAGGYGRSRLQEWVFGGVTQRLLQQEAKFVMLSH